MSILADAIRAHKAKHPAPVQNFPSPYGRPFKGSGLNPKWGVMHEKQPTVWFHRKVDAERYVRSGVKQGEAYV